MAGVSRHYTTYPVQSSTFLAAKMCVMTLSLNEPKRTWFYWAWTALVYFRHERLTRPGQFVLIGALASGIAVGFPDRMVGTLAFSSFAALIAVSLVISLL